MKTTMLTVLFLLSPAVIASSATSSFKEVRNVVFEENPTSTNAVEREEIKVYQKNRLPHYEVTSSKFIVGGVNHLLNRAQRTHIDKDDTYPRLEKLVHPNGACFTGVWSITENNPYSGYFKAGSKGLFIGRASTALTETERGDPRGFAFAGKIFPTMNPDKKVTTANFFTADVLMGTQRDRYLDVKMTNSPDIGFRFSVIGMALQIVNTFKGVDKEPNFRPLYPISELGLKADELVKTPKFIMIETDKSVERNDDTDFRDEVNIRKNHAQGIIFNILVNDVSRDQDSREWKKIGTIKANESTVSYGCDRQLHFAHPKMK